MRSTRLSLLSQKRRLELPERSSKVHEVNTDELLGLSHGMNRIGRRTDPYAADQDQVRIGALFDVS
jgi:hypothetical protein